MKRTPLRRKSPMKRSRKKSKPDPNRDPAYLAHLRTLPCSWCGRPPPSDPAHMGRGMDGGTGRKAPDQGAVPLCNHIREGCHPYSHQHGVLPALGTCDHIRRSCEEAGHPDVSAATRSGAGMREWAARVAVRLRAEYLNR